MISEDQLSRLSDRPFSTELRPMPAIIERAGQMRRGRRLRRLGQAGGATALAALMVVAGIQVFGGGAQPGSVTAASGGSYGCTTGYAYTEKLSTLADLVYLPSESATGPLTGPVLSRRETSDCAYRPPQAVAYAVRTPASTCPTIESCRNASAVTKRLEIGAPDAPNQYERPGIGHFDGKVTHPVIKGQPASLYGMDGGDLVSSGQIEPQDWLYLYWTAADGISHELSSRGLSRAELTSVAGQLTFDAQGKADTRSLPEGFTDWAVLRPLPDTRRAATEYRYAEFSFKGTHAEPGWELDVQDRPDYGVAPFGGISVEVGTAQGWWEPDGAGGGNKGQGRLSWPGDDGVQFVLSGNAAPLDLEHALAIAESVTKASPDDPRIARVGVV